MRQLFRKMFFCEAPAQGALFGLTLLFSLPWIIFSLFCFSDIEDFLFDYPLVTLALIALAFLLPLAIRVKSLCSLIPKDSNVFSRIRYQILVAAAFVLWVGGIALLNIELLWIPVFPLMMALGIGFAIHPGARLWERCTLFILWYVFVVGIMLVFAYSILPFYVVIDKLSDGPYPLVQYHEFPVLTPLREGLRIAGTGWSWVAFLTFLCLLLCYLLHVRILARIAKTPVRRLFCRSTVAVLAVCAAIYVVSFAFALHEQRNYGRTIVSLEKHFGKPLSPEVLEKQYFGGADAQPEFWEQLIDAAIPLTTYRKWNSCFISDNYFYSPFNSDLFQEEWDAELYGKWREYLTNLPEITTINASLAGDIPPSPRRYVRPHYVYGEHVYGSKGFKDDDAILGNCVFIKLWLLRFAAERHDIESAKAILARIDNACAFMRRDSFSKLLAMETLRLKGVVRFMEAGFADDSWLDEQTRRLDALESEIPALEREAVYSKAVLFASRIHSLAHHLGDTEAKGADLSKLRFFFPQAWWAGANYAAAIAKTFQCESFSQLNLPAGRSDAFNTDLRYSCHTVNIINALVASILCVRTLLAAERIKRKTGTYPTQMEGMPLDPFTGKPLQYSVGRFEMKVNVLSIAKPKEESEECEDESLDYDCQGGCDTSEGCRCPSSSEQLKAAVHLEPRSFNGVHLFSHGPDADDERDDIHFFIRLDE